MKSKSNELNVDKLVPFAVDLRNKVMQLIKKLLRKDDYDELVKKVNTIDISGLLKKQIMAIM